MAEETTDVATDTNVEVEEDTNISEEVDTSDDSTEEAVVPKSKLDDALKAQSQLTARAKKAEEALKAFKDSPPLQTNDQQLPEELKLIARGLTDEVIEKAKIIAKGNNISLQEALKDDMLIAFQAKEVEDKKKADAKLGASKGSGETKEKSGYKPGMTAEEHKKAFQEARGK